MSSLFTCTTCTTNSSNLPESPKARSDNCRCRCLKRSRLSRSTAPSSDNWFRCKLSTSLQRYLLYFSQIFFRTTQARLQDTFDVQVPENFIRFRAQQSFHVRQIGVLHCPRADDLRRRILAPLPEEILLWIADPYVHHVARPRWRKKFLSRNRNLFLFERSIQMVINRLRDYIQGREGKNNKLRGSNDDN